MHTLRQHLYQRKEPFLKFAKTEEESDMLSIWKRLKPKKENQPDKVEPEEPSIDQVKIRFEPTSVA